MTERDVSLFQDELDDHLTRQRTIRLATVGKRGPQVLPLWIVSFGCATSVTRPWGT
jgi:nitroimidazol reductase NimA-like FMN-containing flavoprotein (pyridoxamine 5'-phosphate oxidase superfamily)